MVFFKRALSDLVLKPDGGLASIGTSHWRVTNILDVVGVSSMFSRASKGKALSWITIGFSIIIGHHFGSQFGLTPDAARFFALFLAVALGLILEPVPSQQFVFYAVLIAAVTKTVTIETALAGYGNPIVWMVLSAMFMSKAMIKCGLGKRISLYLIRGLGKRTLGVGYAISLTDLLLGIVIPSNLARSGSILFPLVRSIAQSYGSTAENEPKKIGSYLVLLGFHTDNVICALLMTGQASNLLLGRFAANVGVRLDHQSWFLMTCVPGILLVLLMPLVLYVISPPDLKITPDAPRFAKQELQNMGKLSLAEKVMLAVFSLCILLWYQRDFFGVHVAVTALIGVSILLIFQLLDWDDLIGDKKAWGLYVWYGGLVMLADQFERLGVAQQFIDRFGGQLQFASWKFTFFILLLIYSYTQYLFASLTAHIMALFNSFLVLSIAFGVPPVIAVFGLFVASNLCACLTHFATTPAPIYFASGYVSKLTWWKVGFILSVFYMVFWWTVGGLWISQLNLKDFMLGTAH